MTLLYFVKYKFSGFFRCIMRSANQFSTRQCSCLADSREKFDARAFGGVIPDITSSRFCASFAFSAGRFMKRKPTKLRETSKGDLQFSPAALRMKIIAFIVAKRWPTRRLTYKRTEH